ncbi:uncharacterized protein LOC110821196 isoform X2 [Carica papaya]|uniref:uncharacterized protein LOC110821196 isoform X2 n=1 Tax=Carica papaya TaxID=3649 RepID=UPI000B8D049F|nr:uncharacterized protein LOC110821196 isoform X2 [Carica papaya]
MATALPPITRSSYCLKKPLLLFPPLISSPIHQHCSSLRLLINPNPRARLAVCLAAAPGPPSPPDSDRSAHRDPTPLRGIAGTFSRIRDRVQIFFAVFFWLSLFFWASVGDGSHSGRPKKGSRFK